jgi:hypothetical protein
VKFSFKIFRLSSISISLILILSSCIGNTRTDRLTQIPTSVFLETATQLPESTQSPRVEKGTSTTLSLPGTEALDGLTAQGAVEAYYEFMNAQKYSEAYQLLSPLKPHLKTIEEYVSGAENHYKSYELLSVESLPSWVSTTFTNDPTKNKTVVENDQCKRFIVEVKVEYKEDQMGAGPSGTYSYALTVIKDEDGWKIVQIDTISDPKTCEKYK